MRQILRAVCIFLFLLLLYGCTTPPKPKDYSQLRAADPHSILIVPVVNRSVDVDAPNYFLSTISVPIAERGYYVYPVNMVKHVMEDGGLGDADMVHRADPTALASLFGADSVLYVNIERWEAKYAVLATTTTVELNYVLKSGKTGEKLWSDHEKISYTPQNAGAGNPLAMLIVAAVNAAIERAAPNYMPLARLANAEAVTTKHRGLPAGPYNGMYQKDVNSF